MIAYLWDTATLTPENYIIMNKVLFYRHLMTLEDGSLAKDLALLQKEYKLEGLVSEALTYISNLGITCDPLTVSKAKWKYLVKEAVHKQNKIHLLE